MKVGDRVRLVKEQGTDALAGGIVTPSVGATGTVMEVEPLFTTSFIGVEWDNYKNSNRPDGQYGVFTEEVEVINE